MSDANRPEIESIRLNVPPSAKPERLDRFLSDNPDLDVTRTRIQKLIAAGMVLVDGRVVAKHYILKPGQTVSVTIMPEPKPEPVAEEIPLALAYEDDQVAVVDKPAGLVTHPAPGNYSGTLVNALMYHFKTLAGGSGRERPGIVHRLDKNTSGLILVAKTDGAYQRLQQQMQRREIRRTYVALVCGHMREDTGVIELPVGRSLKDRKKMAVTNLAGREAVTRYRLQERFRTYDLLEVDLLTGRTHQIRVHFSHLGHPVFGDPDYGGRHKWHRGAFGPERQLGQRLLAVIDRQALHAARLRFAHPVSGEEMELSSDVPGDFGGVLELLRKEGQ